MKNTTKLFAAAVVGLSFASSKASDFFTTETKQVLGAAVGGAAVAYVAEEQWSNYASNKQTATNSQKAGYAAMGLALTAAGAYAVDVVNGGTLIDGTFSNGFKHLAAVSLLAAVATYVYQQKGRSEAEQQAVYDYAGQGLSAAQAQAAKATADASKAKAAAPAPKAPAKK